MALRHCQNKQKPGNARKSAMHVRLRVHMRATVLQLSATVCWPKQTGLMRSSSRDREGEKEEARPGQTH